MKTFTLARAYDRDTGNRYLIDGSEVGRSNYEEHGSDGMSLADDLFGSIARAIGAEVEVKDVPSHPEDAWS